MSGRFHVVYTVGNPDPVEVPFTADEEAAADASAAGPYRVPKSVITQRLIDTRKISAAMAALRSDDAAYARWIAADQPAVNSDDTDARALLQAIGADPAVILAP